MRFVSTRNSNNIINFSQAITNCVSDDGGLFVPANPENLKPWIYYLDETTSFASMAGSLTSAMINEEFSPIISEAIATRAFPFSPKLKQLDDSFYELDLYTGPTGSHKDFGISYLTACLEYTLLMQDKKATLIGVCNKSLSSSVAYAMRGKKRLKAVLLFEKGAMKGLSERDFIWNGGNIYPVEVDGSLRDCGVLVQKMFADKDLVKKDGLTLVNTMNIGRLLPQTFFYTYAFSRLKGKVFGDIFYALAPGNYSNLVAGLYAWRFSLPVNGFVTECTEQLTVDSSNRCHMIHTDGVFSSRAPSDPSSPSNLERMEEVFLANPGMIKGLVFPHPVSESERVIACKELFSRFGILADAETSGSYAALKKQFSVVGSQDSTVVLVVKDNPALNTDFAKRCCGQVPEIPANIQAVFQPVVPKKTILPNISEVKEVLKELDF